MQGGLETRALMGFLETFWQRGAVTRKPKRCEIRAWVLRDLSCKKSLLRVLHQMNERSQIRPNAVGKASRGNDPSRMSASSMPEPSEHAAEEQSAASMNAHALREWRQARGVSQGQLATMLDVPINTIARWERGEVAIRHPRILALALQMLAGTVSDPATIERVEAQIRPHHVNPDHAKNEDISGYFPACRNQDDF